MKLSAWTHRTPASRHRVGQTPSGASLCRRLRCILGVGAWLVSGLFPTYSNGAVVTWPIDAGGNGHAYEFINSPVLWPQARAQAEARTPPDGFMPGTLVCILSGTENQFLTSQFQPAAWMGFTDEAVEGEWRWIDGTPGVWQDPDNFPSPIQTLYVNWMRGEPSNSSDGTPEHYGVKEGGSLGLWNDGVGGPDGSPYPYIVEYAPVPEPSALAIAAIGIAVGSCRLLRAGSRRP
jgi:hypothetical protein